MKTITLPESDGDDADNGWRFPFAWLQSVHDECECEKPALETIQEVLLAASKLSAGDNEVGPLRDALKLAEEAISYAYDACDMEGLESTCETLIEMGEKIKALAKPPATKAGGNDE